MKIQVPSEPRPPEERRPPIAPAGKWRGRITATQEPTKENPVVSLMWHFTDDRGQEWDAPQFLQDPALLGDVLTDVGLAGQEVELADIVGREAMIYVRTFGGETSAKVVGTDPLPAEQS